MLSKHSISCIPSTVGSFLTSAVLVVVVGAGAERQNFNSRSQDSATAMGATTTT